MITQPQTPEEVYYHNTGIYEDFACLFWLSIQPQDDIYDDAHDYAWSVPEDGEPERISTRFDTRFADLLDEEVAKSPECQWLDERGITYSVDTGYCGTDNRVLLWLNGDDPKRDAMLFKLTFGGN